MKVILRYFTFSLLSVVFAQSVITGFKPQGAILLIVVAIMLLNLLSNPIIRVVSLPSKGIGYFLVNYFLTAISLYVLGILISQIRFEVTPVPSFLKPYIMVPLASLNPMLTTLTSAFFISMAFSYLSWLTS